MLDANGRGNAGRLTVGLVYPCPYPQDDVKRRHRLDSTELFGRSEATDERRVGPNGVQEVEGSNPFAPTTPPEAEWNGSLVSDPEQGRFMDRGGRPDPRMHDSHVPGADG